MKSWDFYNPVQLFVGRDIRSQLASRLNGKKLLIVCSVRGRKQIYEDRYLSKLHDNNNVKWVDNISGNPSLVDLQHSIELLKDYQFDSIIAFGGGSVIDAAKAINITLSNKCGEFSLKELIENPKLHSKVITKELIAIPTTAGTGSEVTPFATVWDHQKKKKLSISGPSIFPTIAFIDASLTDSQPYATTVSTGLDAINQAAESIWNNNANIITLSYATRALKLGLSIMSHISENNITSHARDSMAEASLLAGLAISHTRTALCHSISYPLTAHFSVPHGLACAFTMPAVLRHNLKADDGRFTRLAKEVTGYPDLHKLSECFDILNENLTVRERVKSFIPDKKSLDNLKSEMITPGRAENNIAPVKDLDEILSFSWGK